MKPSIPLHSDSDPQLDPHGAIPELRSGTPLAEATHALILLHGRGATAESILPLADHLGLPDSTHIIAPQAAGMSWYPYSFMAPRDANQPGLDSALRKLDQLLQELLDHLPTNRIVIGGFSQGACLASEFTASSDQPPGGLLAFSGGVIGETLSTYKTPADRTSSSSHHSSFEGSTPLSTHRTAVFLGCSDRDPHIPLSRVKETEEIFILKGYEVDCRIYPGMGHTINGDELSAARQLISRIFS